MRFLWYIFIALIPGIFWLWFYRRQDKKPEPMKLLFKVFFWGMLATIPAIVLELAVDFIVPFSQSQNFTVIVLSTLFVVAPIEEYLKYIVVREKIFKHKEFDQAVDGIIYAIVAALGFASFENILVIFSEGESAILLRFATATLMHALTSGIIGFYMGLAKFSPDRKKSLIRQGIIIAIILHSLYNIIAITDTPLTFVLLAVLLLIMYFMLSKGIKEMQRSKKESEPKRTQEQTVQSDENLNNNQEQQHQQEQN